MEDAVFRTMLFDCYGELLTEKQREYFDLHYNEDLSLAEIAESEGISRQGVWDTIRRGEETMRRYEQKTGLVARFAAQRELIGRAEAGLRPLTGSGDPGVRAAAEEIAEILRELRHGI
jgi:predicted DNA-binding protein YlxM (UPF0122 family)